MIMEGKMRMTKMHAPYLAEPKNNNKPYSVLAHAETGGDFDTYPQQSCDASLLHPTICALRCTRIGLSSSWNGSNPRGCSTMAKTSSTQVFGLLLLQLRSSFKCMGSSGCACQVTPRDSFKRALTIANIRSKAKRCSYIDVILFYSRERGAKRSFMKRLRRR